MIYSIIKSQRVKSVYRAFPLARECLYSLRYPNKYPRYAEVLEIDTKILDYFLPLGGQTLNSGRITRYFDRSKMIPIDDLDVFKICKLHWLHGLSWEESGAYKRMELQIQKHGSYDDCFNMNDVIIRYKRLDELFNMSKRNKLMVIESNYRGEGGILVHLDEHGFYFGGNGNHRLAIAKILNIPRLRVQLGSITLKALDNISKYRVN